MGKGVREKSRFFVALPREIAPPSASLSRANFKFYGHSSTPLSSRF